MRILRIVVAVLVWLLAFVLLVLAVVLSLTVVLLPVGVAVGYLSLRLFRFGLRCTAPRAKDVQKALRKTGRQWRRRTRKALRDAGATR
ncbi:hypothetical protein [Pseudonocardia sp.]|uniref:hypothetical protein n=1 Tax=Pseudonocardia sp. TaxID=60912 RepID=UPI003D0DA684